MRPVIPALVFAAIVACPAAPASSQTAGATTTRPVGPAAATPMASRLQAPVGHRQPRATSLPPETSQAEARDGVSAEDAEMNRRINGICRGC